jgi:uncharacterized RDD family membrane protein YckC
MEKPLPLAPLARRTAAGVVDAVLLSGLSAVYFLVPLLTSGLTMPMWGVLAAGVGYSIVPLAAFRATLGMKLFGLELCGRDGHGVNPADLLSRELVGRGLLPGAFLFSLFMNFIGSLLGVTSFAMPAGLGFVMALVSLTTMTVVGPGHLLPLIRDDRRSLADLMARSFVVPARPAEVPADEDDRAWQKRQRRRRATGVLVFELALVAGALALPYLLMQRTGVSTEAYADRLIRTKMEKDFGRAPADELIARQLADAYRKAGRPDDAEKIMARNLQAVLDQLGCDRKRALSFGDRMNREQRYEVAVQLVKQYEAKCEPWRRLLWVALYAHQQRGEWKEVSRLTTRLIEEQPSDSDFWWWRGEAFAKSGEYEQAAADYHQSIANLPNGYAAGRYAKWVDKELKRPCEGAFALGYWMDLSPDEVGEWAPPERARLYLAGDCDKLLGRGATALELSPEAPVSTAKLGLGGKSGTIALTQAAGYTLLSKDFAARAGIDATAGAQVQVYFAGAWTQAHLVTLPEVRLGQAKAEQVLAGVVDQLPAGLDAVMGVNLAWRFHVANDGNKLTFKPWTPVAAKGSP